MLPARDEILTTQAENYARILTTRRIPIPEKMIVVGGNIYKLTLWHEQVTRLAAVTRQADALAKCGRQCVKDIHGWIEPLSESLIAAPRLIEFVGFPFKYGEDGFGRIAGFDLSSERVGGQVFASLLLILFQGLFEDRLKVCRG